VVRRYAMQLRVGGNGLLLALYGEVVFLTISYRQDLGATLPLPRNTVQVQFLVKSFNNA
jgi:hypothetical protein